MERTAEHCQPAHEKIRKDIRGSPEVVPDETGWRVGGRYAWLHAFVGARETCYVIDPTRSHQPAEKLLGIDWEGTLVHDGWSVYDRFTGLLINNAWDICNAVARPCSRRPRGAAVRLPRAVLDLIHRAYALRRPGVGIA